jgi:large subunit ribosomal protein L24
MKIHKNDTVIVISGNARGKTGKVLKVYPDKGRVIVEGVNIIKRHTRPNQRNPQGGIVQRESSINASNVMLLDPKNGEPTRVGTKITVDETTKRKKRMRVSRTTGETF